MSTSPVYMVALLVFTASCGHPATQARRQPTAEQTARRVGPSRRPVDRRPSFVVKFDRPLRVGFRYRDVTTGTMETKLIIGGKPSPHRSKKLSYIFEAVVTVKGVMTDGRATHKELRIVRLKSDAGPGSQTLLAAGTVVDARLVNQKKRFTVGGKAVSAPTHEVLRQVVTLSKRGSKNNDELIGTDLRRRIGQSWTPSKRHWIAMIKRSLENRAATPRTEDITGKITLVGKREVDGLEVLDVRGRVRVDNVAPKLGSTGTKGHTAGHVELRFSGWVPVDTSVTARETSYTSMRYYLLNETVVGGTATTFVVDSLVTQTCTLSAAP